MRGGRLILFLLSVVIGLYFINSSFAFYELSDSITNFDNLLRVLGGILLILGGIGFLKKKHPNQGFDLGALVGK